MRSSSSATAGVGPRNDPAQKDDDPEQHESGTKARCLHTSPPFDGVPGLVIRPSDQPPSCHLRIAAKSRTQRDLRTRECMHADRECQGCSHPPATRVDLQRYQGVRSLTAARVARALAAGPSALPHGACRSLPSPRRRQRAYALQERAGDRASARSTAGSGPGQVDGAVGRQRRPAPDDAEGPRLAPLRRARRRSTVSRPVGTAARRAPWRTGRRP